ncbi:aldo/keto reductase [Alkaliphilus metalliredigens QYMF]|uniref:Aldo/keto reductase n=1 Tax=Alkaliphilus metalliredigens (strain QYMF) TaxID=293826 RepID=A6TLR0_ALKMQ|nr:aldo/keto reductase [Alkaliphilus metalliredigens]ABR47128.1 aldo/keto reductase [Alkaliphilus metalliredigens QYMF]
MIYREYGQTGKKLSVVGFGGMRFGPDEDYGAQVVQRANSLGINYFDTAPFYCNDRSEDIFGKAFKNMPGQYYVSTKSNVGKESTADQVRWRIENSLKRMGIDKINFFHMWCIMDLNQYDRVMAKGGPYEGALKAKEEGLIDHLVFSTHCKGSDIRKIIEDDVFEGVLLGYNVVNHAFRQEGVQAALENKLGIVTMNPLGGGLIPQHQDYFSLLKEREDETVSQAALRFNAAQEGITVVLAGMGTIEEVEENVKIVDHPLTVSKEKVQEIRSKITESMDMLCTACGYCNKCPQKINIPTYMEAYNLSILKDDQETKHRLNWLREQEKIKEDDAKTDACVACGICEELCTQKLPIIERLKEMSLKY